MSDFFSGGSCTSTTCTQFSGASCSCRARRHAHSCTGHRNAVSIFSSACQGKKKREKKETQREGILCRWAGSVAAAAAAAAECPHPHAERRGPRAHSPAAGSCGLFRPCLLSRKICKIFHILCHIESLDVCMEY